MDAVAPGGSYLYAFNANSRASMNRYHPHPHMLTGRQVALGLAGAEFSFDGMSRINGREFD